jgi:sugar/nucleoside kinase (ribokinase family)
VDHLIHVPEEYLDQIGGKKWGMEAVSYAQMIQIIEKSGTIPKLIAGGSGANVAKGLGKLGHKVGFLGKIGEDPIGETFIEGLQRSHVIPNLATSQTPTGHAVCLITPDGQRTCRTYLGASRDFGSKDLEPEMFHGCQWVHIEGYQLINGTVVEKAMLLAKQAGAKISFDLSSFEIVETFKMRILELIKGSVHLLFANQEEAKALFGLEVDPTCKMLTEFCKITVITQGEKGCTIGADSKILSYPAYPVIPLDTTGAGDLFQSGFIHGLLLGKPVRTAARFGALCAQAVVQVVGAEVDQENWIELKRKLC